MKEKKQINIEIGQRIKEYRENANMTQEKLAERVELGVKHISAIECGAVGVSLSTLKRFCTVLSVSADTLVFGRTESGQGEKRNSEIQTLAENLLYLPEPEFEMVKDIINRIIQTVHIDK